MLMEFLRNLAMGAIADEVRKTPQGQKLQEEYVKPVAETVVDTFAPVDTRASSIGTQLDAEGYPTNSPMLEAQTAPYRPNASFKAEPISPYELQDMARMVAGEQQSRQGELDQLVAAENAQNAQGVQDFVRQASQDIGTATTQPYQRTNDATAMFQSSVTETANRLQQEAPDATPEEVVAGSVIEEGRKDPSFFDVMGDKISDFFGSEEKMLNLALAFNTLRYQPDNQLAAGIQDRLKVIKEQTKTNKTAEWLRKKGTKNAITAAEYLEAGGKLKDAMELFKGTDYGLTPIKIMDEKGNIKLIQLNKNGQTREVSLPEGFTAAPDIQKVDAGTGTVILDKHGNQIGFVPKDVAGVEAAKVEGKYTQEQINAAPQSYQNAKSKLKVIQDFLDHPSFDAVFGAVQGRSPTIRQGTLDAEAYLDQIKGAAFLAAFESLKGGGQISNTEGLKAEQAMARLKTVQSEKEAKKALNELAEVLRVGMAKARQMAPDKINQLESYYPQEQTPQAAPVAKPQITPEQAAAELARRRGQ